LRTNEHLIKGDAVLDQLPIFTGAGQFSADPVKGLKRLVETDKEACTGGHTTEAVPATCAVLFKAPKAADATKTPPDPGSPGDPRYQVCVAANMVTGLCSHLGPPGADGVSPIVTNFDPLLEGAFRTPQLINIAETGPYFHTGEFKTLRDVVWHYNAGGGVPGTFVGTKSPRLRPLLLTDKEVDDLVEFLKTLTGEVPFEWACNPLVGPDKAANGCGPLGATNTGGTSGGMGGAGGMMGGKGGAAGGASGTGAGGGVGGAVGGGAGRGGAAAGGSGSGGAVGGGHGGGGSVGSSIGGNTGEGGMIGTAGSSGGGISGLGGAGEN
jgi:hypothetical protein